jgi:hypothetical protein
LAHQPGIPPTVAAGAVIALDKGIPHDIQVLQDSELLLTIAKKVNERALRAVTRRSQGR